MTNENKKRCDTCECYDCDCEECTCECHKEEEVQGVPVQMIEFVLVFMMGLKVVDQTQTFEDIDRCLYFAERLHKQPSIPQKEGPNLQITAYCKPIRKR